MKKIVPKTKKKRHIDIQIKTTDYISEKDIEFFVREIRKMVNKNRHLSKEELSYTLFILDN